MQVTFTKAADRKDFPIWVAQAGKRRIQGSGLGSDPRHLPHDVVTLIVERELGIRDGFFGTVGAGGTFRSMAKRANRPGRSVIARNVPSLDAAEKVVNGTWQAWLTGQPTPCNDALDRALEQWIALPAGGQITFDFLPVPSHPAAPKVRHRRR